MIDLLLDYLDDDIYNIFSYIKLNLKKFIDFFIIKNNHLFLYTSILYIQLIVKFISNSHYLKFNVLLDLTAVDYPSELKRFKIIYLLSSLYNLSKVFIFFFTNSNVKIPSLTNVFNSANWAERECFDMFGLIFFNHPDLRRILTDYGFRGFPLRKDFPLSGYKEIFFDHSRQKISFFPIVLTQEFRFLHYSNSWEEWI